MPLRTYYRILPAHSRLEDHPGRVQTRRPHRHELAPEDQVFASRAADLREARSSPPGAWRPVTTP